MGAIAILALLVSPQELKLDFSQDPPPGLRLAHGARRRQGHAGRPFGVRPGDAAGKKRAFAVDMVEAGFVALAADYLPAGERISMVGHPCGGHSTIFTTVIEPRIRAAWANGPVSESSPTARTGRSRRGAGRASPSRRCSRTSWTPRGRRRGPGALRLARW